MLSLARLLYLLLRAAVKPKSKKRKQSGVTLTDDGLFFCAHLNIFDVVVDSPH